MESGKTVYVDNVSLNNYASSGTLTSSIFDTQQESNWGSVTLGATTPSGTSVGVKVRTSKSSDVLGASDFSNCSTLSSGASITSSNSCAHDQDQYIQYQLVLSTSNTANTPTITSISLSFTPKTSSASSSPSSSSSFSSSTANVKQGWAYPIMAGPHYVGAIQPITNSITTPGFSIMVPSGASSIDLSFIFSIPSFDKPGTYCLSSLEKDKKGMRFPWNQGFNTQGKIYCILAFSSFNGYPVLSTEKPFTITIPYILNKNIIPNSLNTLSIAYYDQPKKRWKLLTTPMVINSTNHTISTTTRYFGMYVVVKK